MPKDEWGVKRLCPSCSTRFYDLQNDPMTCPNCGNTFDVESLTAKKSPTRAEKKEPAAVVVAEAEEAEVVLDDDTESEESNDVDIDDDLLEDDDDDTVNLDEIADVPAEEDDS